MFTSAKRVGLAAAVSLAVLGMAVPDLFAQGIEVSGGGGVAAGRFRIRPRGATNPKGIRGNINPGIGGGGGGVGRRVGGGGFGASPGAYLGPGGGGGTPGNLDVNMPNPNYLPEGNYDGLLGGYLQGAASVISAQGQFMINNQQATLMKEQVRQARMDSRRKVMEEWLWERQNLPTLQDELERRTLEEFRRSRFDPPLTEIWSGKALNDLLLNVQQMHAKRLYGPEVTLDPDLLKQVNVTAKADGGNIGILKNEGRLSWPLGLRDLAPAEETKELRSQIDSLVAEAVNQAINGRVEPAVLNQLRRNTDRMRKALERNVGDMPFGDYGKSKRFLNDLDAAIKVLEQDDAGQYLTGKYAAQGKNVKELVEHMTRSGLSFAAVVPGGEAGYRALRNALAEYAVGPQPELVRQPAPAVGPDAVPVK